jgi:hypothetical protein
MANCWAEADGNCAGGKSGEHLVSKSLFITKKISVQGFSWCKNEPKIVGLNRVTAGILCQKHNNTLSPLDSEASAAFDILRQHFDNAQPSHKFSPLAELQKVAPVINAKLLERWFLKTLINLTYSGKYQIGPNSEVGKPSPRLVNIAYGKAEFEGGEGMYVAAHSGMLFSSTDTLQLAPLIKDDCLVLGGYFEFRGIRFLLSLMPEKPNNEIARINSGCGMHVTHRQLSQNIV